MVTPSGDTGNSLLNGIIEYAGDHAVEQAVAQAVEHVDAVDAFVPCRAPKAIFSRKLFGPSFAKVSGVKLLCSNGLHKLVLFKVWWLINRCRAG